MEVSPEKGGQLLLTGGYEGPVTPEIISFLSVRLAKVL